MCKLATTLLMIIVTSEGYAQSFDAFLDEYKVKNYGSYSQLLQTTLKIRQTVSTVTLIDNIVVNKPLPYDSVIIFQKIPFQYRSNSFRSGTVDCLCQDSGATYLKNHLTKFERVRLNTFRINGMNERLDLSFVDPIIGWQGVSEQKPVVKDTIIGNKKYYKLTHKSRQSNIYVYWIDDESFKIEKSQIFDTTGLLQRQTQYKNYHIVENMRYAKERVHEIYVSNEVVRIIETIESIIYDYKIPLTGVYDCVLEQANY
jgi:hypothetical protein